MCVLVRCLFEWRISNVMMASGFYLLQGGPMYTHDNASLAAPMFVCMLARDGFETIRVITPSLSSSRSGIDLYPKRKWCCDTALLTAPFFVCMLARDGFETMSISPASWSSDVPPKQSCDPHFPSRTTLLVSKLAARMNLHAFGLNILFYSKTQA